MEQNCLLNTVLKIQRTWTNFFSKLLEEVHFNLTLYFCLIFIVPSFLIILESPTQLILYVMVWSSKFLLTRAPTLMLETATIMKRRFMSQHIVSWSLKLFCPLDRLSCTKFNISIYRMGLWYCKSFTGKWCRCQRSR